MINAVVWTDLDDAGVGLEEGFDAEPVFEAMRPRELKHALAYIRRDLQTAASAQAGGWVSGTEVLDDLFPRAVKLVLNPNLLEVQAFCEKNDLGWYCSVRGQDALSWYSRHISTKAANRAVDTLLAQEGLDRWNLVQAWVVAGGGAGSVNLALWLEQASEAEIEELWRSRIESDRPGTMQLSFSGPIVLDIVGWLALRYRDLEPVYYKAKMGSKNITLAVEKASFQKWLTHSRGTTVVKQAVDTLLGQHFELPESV